MNTLSRRQFVAGVGLTGLGMLASESAAAAPPEDVSAVEDLMREHGVLRRALLIYDEAVLKLRNNPTPAVAEALQKTAKLFRAFGEDYHEKKLEEAHIFPDLKKADGTQELLVDTLGAQHERGRQITDYLLAVSKNGKMGRDKAGEVARVLEPFVLMYQNHMAREDTVIFPAWKRTLSAGALDKMGDTFEDIERAQFGKDGFETSVRQIAEVEAALGLADIGQFTPPPPPRL